MLQARLATARLSILLCGAAISFVPVAASAQLSRTSPAAGAILAITPTHIRLEFSERPVLRFTSLTLVDEGRVDVPLRDLRYASDTRNAVTMLLTDALHDGVYTVQWSTVGTDGARVSGDFNFTVRRPRINAESLIESMRPGSVGPVALHERAPRDTLAVGSSEYVTIRWFEYIGIALVIGAATFRHFVLPRGPRGTSASAFSKPLQRRLRFRAAAVGLVAAVLLGFAQLLRLAAQWLVLNGPIRPFSFRTHGMMLLTTPWGWGWLLQSMGAFTAAVGFALAGLLGHRRGWTIAAAGTVLIVASGGLGGHLASLPVTPAVVLSDALHVLSVGGWAGTLAVMVLASFPVVRKLAPAGRAPALAELVRPFSRLAVRFAAILVATGLFTAVLRLGSIPALWHSAFGRVLLVKLCVLVLVALAGAYTWKRLVPLLAENRGASRFREMARIEVALGALVLLISALLVAMPTTVHLSK